MIDAGTGDARGLLGRARSARHTLFVGLDANAAAMREAARRAAAKPARGGSPNVLFVVASVEAAPPELSARADEVTVEFPWGSLLRGVLGADGAVLSGLASLLAPGARLRVLCSLVERDGSALPDEAALRDAYAAASLRLDCYRDATGDEIAAARSSWARRLGAGVRRPVRLITARRPALDESLRRGDPNGGR